MKRLIPLLMTILLLLSLSCPAMAENKFYFDRDYSAVFENGVLPLVLIREGDCAQAGELTFVSSNRTVATVDGSGLVYGHQKGQATITATLKGASRSWTAKLLVTVQRAVTGIEVTGSNVKTYQPWDPVVANVLAPDSPWVDLPVLMLRAGVSQTITAKCTPSDASNREWQLISSDESIVRTTGTTFTGVKAGECWVAVRSKQNPEVEQAFRALVVQSVTRVQVMGDEKTIYVGEQIPLYTVVSPDNATIRGVTWSSDRADNASVDGNGLVTGVSKGSAVITAKAADGSGRYGTYTVTVRQQPENITLSRTDVDLKKGNYITLKATVLPDITNDKTVTWASSDSSVAKVTTAGRVTAVNPGIAIIACRSKTHPEVFAQAIVRVYQPVTKISFIEKNPYMGVGESIRLNWEVGPENATDHSVTLSTNKPSVVSISQDGTITGLKRGECYVYATANDGSGVKGTVKVTVTQPVEGVSIATETIYVGVGETATNSAVFLPDDASITEMAWYSQDASIATVSGTDRRVTVRGRSWGETTIIGVTEDGSYVTTFNVMVGDEDDPLNIVKLHVENGDTIRIQVYNESNLTITRFYYEIRTYDAWGNALICNKDGWSNAFEGSYKYTLAPGAATQHGRFSFGSEFSRPDGIGKVVMTITAYQTDDGSTHYIPRTERESREWKVKIRE